MQEDVNGNAGLLARCEAVRAHGAVVMGLAASANEATSKRPHTPKLAFATGPQDYTASGDRRVARDSIDLVVRILSMGKLHHAMTGTGAVAIAVAAAIPGTIVSRVVGRSGRGGQVRFGHPSGTMAVGAEAAVQDGEWVVARVSMSRSARRLMEGWVRVPADAGVELG